MQREALVLILATLMASSAATAQGLPRRRHRLKRPGQRPREMRRVAGCRNKAPSPHRAPRPPTREWSRSVARSDGVLCLPTGVDPEIRAPTPETGNMPVIPPPGSPAAIRRSGQNKSGVAADLKQQHPKIWK
jgi:hypothetical protein